MKKYVVLLFSIFILVIICFFLTRELWVKNVVKETIIKKVIPYELSQALSTEWKGISVIKKEKMKKGWECYLFALSSEKSKEFFIATVFNPSERIESQVDYFAEAKDTSLIYLCRLVGSKEADIKGCEIVLFKGCEIVHLANLSFLVLRLKNVQINEKPFEECL